MAKKISYVSLYLPAGRVSFMDNQGREIEEYGTGGGTLR